MAAATVAGLMAIAASAGATDGKENPGSLVGNGSGAVVNPYTDRVARQAGDLLTVIIEEQTVSSFSANTTATKSDSSGISSEFFNNLLDRLIRPITTGANSTTGGNGSTGQNSSMRARMTVVVREVLPNGVLVVEGRRTLITNRETQTIVMTGLVRRDSVRPDNSVLSTQVADAEIRFEGRGTIADRQRKGILTELIDWLF